jgi:hypothetical protein
MDLWLIFSIRKRITGSEIMWGGRMTTQGHLGTLIGFRQKLFTGSDGILRVPSERKSELTMHGIKNNY